MAGLELLAVDGPERRIDAESAQAQGGGQRADPPRVTALCNAEALRARDGGVTSGIPFQIEVQRFAADSAVAETFTDTITYSDTARILQVQRSEVGGEVSDLRDPDARSTLLRVRPDGLSAAGLAGPPGTGGDFDEGIVGFALDATC